MNHKLKVIANPIAGSGRAKKLITTLKDALKKERIEYSLTVTTQSGEARQIAEHHNEPTPILCLGGDGTFNEIINGLKKAQVTLPTLGIIPFGSGNVIAKELHLKRSIRQFIHLYQNNLTRDIDIGCVSVPPTPNSQLPTPNSQVVRYFVSMVGVGFDAEVARQYQSRRGGSAKLHAHLFSYLPIAMRTLFRYRMPVISITIDGKTITQGAGFIQIANVRSYGGPFVLVNNAVFDDGELNLEWLKTPSTARSLSQWISTLGVYPTGTLRSTLTILLYYTFGFLGNGSLVSNGSRRVGANKKILLTSQDLVPVQVDGDFCGYLPMEIEVIPSCIRVFSPCPLRDI
ncbi:MAG: diacylglycerol kinase family lipid kinase [Planctomycetota bacterium]|nr:diacylglycerol kinase family lipid kinase [Planctomycetota bacterium]MDI6787261.1 diacylglycerol kinase family lipid kinase [Planctomycetota bacterium]